MSQSESITVYLLWHTDAHGDEKLLGVFDSQPKAASAAQRAGTKPGFSAPAGKFEIAEYTMNHDYWTDGFTRGDGTSLPKWFCPENHEQP
jgi:hypothetical protein